MEAILDVIDQSLSKDQLKILNKRTLAFSIDSMTRPIYKTKSRRKRKINKK